jgi:hypothetical protein
MMASEKVEYKGCTEFHPFTNISKQFLFYSRENQKSPVRIMNEKCPLPNCCNKICHGLICGSSNFSIIVQQQLLVFITLNAK